MQLSVMSVLLSILLILGLSEAGLLRSKRQDWNFPGGVDSNNNVNERPPQRPPQRPEQTTRPQPQPQPTRPPQNEETATLPESGTVFAAPCNRCMTTFQYNPVCGSDSRTYANQGILDCSRMCGINVQLGRLGVCQTPR